MNDSEINRNLALMKTRTLNLVHHAKDDPVDMKNTERTRPKDREYH